MASIISIALALVLMAASVFASQTTRVVDPYGGTGYTSIGSAALASSAGDTILIKEFRTTSGGLTGYSENHVGGGESFPISIPAGITVKSFSDDDQVLIWSTSSSNSIALFQLEGAAATAPQTRIEELGFFAGAPAIDVPGASGTETRAVIARCDFSWNSIAISALAGDDHHHYLTVRDCRLLDYKLPEPLPLPPNGVPGYQNPGIGLRFHAMEQNSTSAPGQIDALVDGLVTAGQFDFTDDVESPRYSIVNGDYGPNGPFSRVIEVYSEGDGSWLEHTTPTSPLSEVRLLVQSCTLTGKATLGDLGQGWDVGIFAATATPPIAGVLTDYTAGFQVQVVGTNIDGFLENGIYASSTSWTRGTVKVEGNSAIVNTGAQTTPSFGGRSYGGVHCSIEDGCYMQLECRGSSFNNNTGSGISLRSFAVKRNTDFIPPLGNFLSLENCNIHQNGSSGLRIEAAGGLGGGAHHFMPEPGFPSQRIPNLHQSAATSVFSVPSGQGLVDRCNISNNGEPGIHLLADGTTNTITGLSTRFVNCMVWHNPFGGVFADLQGHVSSPYMLTPFLHCTFAANGTLGTFPHSIRIVEEQGEDGVYLWELSIPGLGDYQLSTKLFNSIFDRGFPSADDFALDTIGLLVSDSPLSTEPANRIGVIGCRYVQDPDPGFPVGTQLQPPFPEYGMHWDSLDPSYLFLEDTNNDFGDSADYIMQLYGEAQFDHQGDARPSYTGGDRDKGAEEKN